MATDTQTNSLIINRLTKAQYDAIETKSNTELYLIPDEIDSVPTYQSENCVSSGGVYGALQTKAELSGPTFTGAPKAPTAAAGTNTTQIATTAFVQTAISGKQDTLVSGTSIKTINNESLLGEGNISISGGSGGEANVIESISVNSVAQTVTNKNVDITVPTTLASLSDDATHRLVTDTEKSTWDEKVSNVQADWNASSGLAVILNKPTIPSAVTESTVSGWGFTKNAGTLTGVKFNNADATVSNGVASITATIPAAPGTLNTNNSTAQTASSSEALSGTIKLHKVAKTGTYSDLIGTPTIPTESTVSGWGFTKNAGTLTGVTFNGSAATVSSGVAAITATIPNITISSSEPTSSQGSNGDIWIVV